MELLIITAIGVFIAALTVLYQNSPHLRESTITNHKSGTFTIKVKNTGKGNAKIINMQLEAYGFSTNNETIDEFVDKIAQPIDMQGNPNIELNIWEKGDEVGSGEELTIFEVIIPKENNDLEKTFRSLELNVSVKSQYRSILGIPFNMTKRNRKV